MSNAMITQGGLIRVGHPVREEFSECSSGNGPNRYYKTKGQAVSEFGAVLSDYELQFDPADCMDMPGDEGRMVVEVYSNELECADYVANAVLMWHRMDRTGRWEVIGYIA